MLDELLITLLCKEIKKMVYSIYKWKFSINECKHGKGLITVNLVVIVLIPKIEMSCTNLYVLTNTFTYGKQFNEVGNCQLTQ